MLTYDRQTKPGLVALYNIRPGNGAGPFLQPRSPHGATQTYRDTDRRGHPAVSVSVTGHNVEDSISVHDAFMQLSPF